MAAALPGPSASTGFGLFGLERASTTASAIISGLDAAKSI